MIRWLGVGIYALGCITIVLMVTGVIPANFDALEGFLWACAVWLIGLNIYVRFKSRDRATSHNTWRDEA